MNTQTILNNLLQKQDLISEETSFLLSEMMNGSISDVQISALLTSLAVKGETVEEIIGFVKTMRKHMIPVHAEDAIDVCGTGGDGKQTFNISTAVSFVVTGAGVQVAKHGNRAASSQCGAADVLEKLGVNILLSPQQAEAVLQKVGMVFLFAPLFHPAMKSVSLVRKALGIRTVFNYLGPFANPASVKRQLIGVPNVGVAEKLAQVGNELKYEELVLVTSNDGMDEISVSNKTYMYEIKNREIHRSIIDPEDFGFNYQADDVRGGDAEYNARIVKNILDGEKGAARDIIVLNSAVALYIAGKVPTIKEGIALAEQSIDSGRAKVILENLIKETQLYA